MLIYCTVIYVAWGLTGVKNINKVQVSNNTPSHFNSKQSKAKSGSRKLHIDTRTIDGKIFTVKKFLTVAEEVKIKRAKIFQR